MEYTDLCKMNENSILEGRENEHCYNIDLVNGKVNSIEP